MKINWKVRLKNPCFWLTIIPTVIAFIYTILSAFDVCPRISESVIIDWLSAVITALATVGILNDPTTSGLDDSIRAMGYEAPYESEYEDCEDRKGDDSNE